ncbi:MAG: metal-dependent hydrolase [Candidatus Roizmanbacteria bacterium]
MSTPAHVLSAAYIALVVSGVDHTNTQLIILALISAACLDLDHLYFIVKDRGVAKIGKLHKARGVVHELLGFAGVGILMLVLGTYNQQISKVVGIAMMVHLAQDVIMGTSIPFNPVDKTEVQLLPQKFKLKLIVDIATIIIFGLLWIKYLSGQV